MDLRIDRLEEHEVRAIAKANGYTAADLILKLVEEVRDQYRNDIEQSPRRCEEDLTQDWVYQAGVVAALNAVLRAPEKAAQLIMKRSKKS